MLINSVIVVIKSEPSSPADVILICGCSRFSPSPITSLAAKVKPEALVIVVFPTTVVIVPALEPPTISISLAPCDIFAESIKLGLLWSVITPVEAT